MVLFLRKKAPAPQAAPGYVPTDLVQRMASTGMPEREIASYLSKQGFSPSQIDAAMREALKAQVSAPPLRPAPPIPRPPAPTPPGPMVPEETEEVPATPTMDFPGPPAETVPKPPVPPRPITRETPEPPAYPPATAIPQRKPLEILPPHEAVKERRDIGVPPERVIPAAMKPVEYATAPGIEEIRPPRRVPEAPTEITVEEIVEGIVAERWIEFEERLNNFEKRDIQLQAQIQDLKKAMAELENRLKAKEADMIGKLDTMTESMAAIQGRIGSIEKVFKDFLPQMTENVRSIAEVVEKLKGS
ncbi:MAG: hypothetical protein QW751_01560 [Candidatus Aenigmatarchaeota archaeon]|nr:hypothetical protein [Candidatus Aenigmarchaeota archaeon]